MDKKIKIKEKWILLAAGLFLLHMPLSVSAEEGVPEPADCICETACTQEERNDACPVCGREDADIFPCAGNMPDAQAAGNDKTDGLIFEWLNEVPKSKISYAAGGGEIIWTPKLSGDQVVCGTLTLKNARINSQGMGIRFPVPVDIIAEGENQITSDSIGIYLSDSAKGADLDLNITGSGNLSVKSNNNGIQTAGNIVVDSVRLEVTYGSAAGGARGLITPKGNIEIRNSNYVKVRSAEGIGANSSAIYAGQNAGQTVKIMKSHVIAISGEGTALDALTGNIELISSDVRAVGKTSGGVSGTLVFKKCTMNGGTLFAQNNGGDEDLEWPAIVSSPIQAADSAVIYGVQEKKLQYIEGDAVWYTGCSYNESADRVTVSGKGYTYGNVTWNSNMSFGEGKSLAIGTYSKKDSTLTIPKGTEVSMPKGSTLNVRYNEDSGVETVGKLVVDGKLNVGDGSSIYNLFHTSKRIGGSICNTGTLTISQGGLLQNRNLLENRGTMNIIGDFTTIMLTNYNGSINNTGIINGFAKEMHGDSYVYVANGKASLKSGQTLTLGEKAADDGKNNILRIPDPGGLTIEVGAVVDAKANVTADTVSDYIDLNDTIIVDGILLLPENISDEALAEIAENIIGKGEVRSGAAVKYIVTVDKGDSMQTQLLQDGELVTLPENLTREGYRFDGWFIKNGNALEPFDKGMEIHASAEIISKWTKLAVNKPEEPQNPDGTKTPEEEKGPRPAEVDKARSTVLLNNKAKVSASGSKLKAAWGKVSEADGYDVYAAKCGSKSKLVKSVKGSDKTSFTIKSIGKKKVTQKGSYKVQVHAYRIVGGKKEVLAKSLTLHAVGESRKGYTNAKKVKVSKAKLTVKKGKTAKIKASTVKQSRRKKLLPKKHIVPYRYYSTNEKVATVTKSGKIKGKRKGSCTVYVVAANGVKKGIKVTVK